MQGNKLLAHQISPWKVLTIYSRGFTLAFLLRKVESMPFLTLVNHQVVQSKLKALHMTKFYFSEKIRGSFFLLKTPITGKIVTSNLESMIKIYLWTTFFHKHNVYKHTEAQISKKLSIFLSLIFVYQLWKVINCPNCCPKLVILAI